MLLSQSTEAAYQISLGRFLQPLYWQIRGEITTPLLIGLFATCFLMLSICLIIDLLEITKPLHIALVSGILSTCETMSISNATYLPWTDVYMLALFFAMLGVHLFFRCRLGFLLSPLCYTLSAGLYQSYLPAASTLIILILLRHTIAKTDARKIWKTGLLSCLSLVCGLLLYALVLNVILQRTGIVASQDYNGVGRVGFLTLAEIPGLLLDTYMTPIRQLFFPSDTPVMTWHISLIPAPLNLVILFLSSCLLARSMAGLPAASILTLLFLVLILPLSMNFIQFVSGGIASGLTIYAYQFFYLLPVVLLSFRGASQHAPHFLFSCVRPAAVCMLFTLICLNMRNAQQMYLKRDLEFSSTLSAMTRILNRAEQTQGYVPGETPVVLIGMLPSSSISMERPGFEQIAQVQGMRYTYAASYETSTYWYLQMALGQPINLVSHEERKALSLTNQAAEMPAFPDEGCCRMIDGYLYLRIS